MKNSWRSLIIVFGVFLLIAYVQVVANIQTSIATTLAVGDVSQYAALNAAAWASSMIGRLSWMTFIALLALVGIERGITYAIEEHKKKGEAHQKHFKIVTTIVSMVSLFMLAVLWQGVGYVLAILFFLTLVYDQIILHKPKSKNSKELHKHLTLTALLLFSAAIFVFLIVALMGL